MDAKERKIIQDKNKKDELENCFEYIKENFTSWDYRFDDPWYKEIQYKENNKNEKEKNQFIWKDEEILPEEQGIYLFNSRTKFEHPYGNSGIYYIGKANNPNGGLKGRLETKLKSDYNSKFDKKGRYIYRNNRKNLNHYYPYLNYYQEFPTTIYCKKIDKGLKDNDKGLKDKKSDDMVPLIEEILISAFFTKMGNRPPSNRTGPNQLIWTDSENSKELINVYDELLSSEILG
jgi:hypothetical protein